MNASGNIMNCEQYKEAIAADPTFEDDAGHVAACAACAEFKADMLVLNESITAALNINVPTLQMPELPDIGAAEEKVVSLASRKRPTFGVPAWIGLAAGFALVAFFGMRFIPNGNITDAELAQEILAHVDHEPWATKVTDVAVTDERLNDVMAVNDGTMSRDLGLVSYAQSCIINGRKIPHLVVQGKDGPITLLLLPEEMVSMPVKLDGRGINGVILPVGDGSIALVGEREFDVEDLKERVMNSVEWST